MALFELNIYGPDDEIIKKYETDKVRWGVYLQATELSESLHGKTISEQFTAISNFIKKLFPDLKDSELENADSDDVMNTFKQLISKANGIKGSEKSEEKNA